MMTRAQVQQGSALIVSMLLMMLLTLTALAAMSNSVVQERMARNTQQHNASFQNAESGLRYVEQQVLSGAMALPERVCTSADCQRVVTNSSELGPDWLPVPMTVNEGDAQVWYRLVRMGDSSIPATRTGATRGTLYQVLVLSEEGASRTLLEGVYAFTRL